MIFKSEPISRGAYCLGLAGCIQRLLWMQNTEASRHTGRKDYKYLKRKQNKNPLHRLKQ